MTAKEYVAKEQKKLVVNLGFGLVSYTILTILGVILLVGGQNTQTFILIVIFNMVMLFSIGTAGIKLKNTRKDLKYPQVKLAKGTVTKIIGKTVYIKENNVDSAYLIPNLNEVRKTRILDKKKIELEYLPNTKVVVEYK